MASQPYHNASDSMYNSLIYIILIIIKVMLKMMNKKALSREEIHLLILIDTIDYFLPNQLPLLFVEPQVPEKLVYFSSKLIASHPCLVFSFQYINKSLPDNFPS